MCGIAGTLALGAPLRETDRPVVERMVRAIRHRGPDSQGVLADENAALGCARLRITDLSRTADMPLVSDDGALWLAYNGAITNFRALSAKFGLDRERALRTRLDSEVLLRLYERLGIEFLSELTGQFAFCLYDRRKQRVFLVRDFFGLRPVFYALHGGKLHFASEIKALLDVRGWDRSLDTGALWHFFSLAYIPGNSTPFAGVRELSGGRLLDIDLRAGTFKEKSYYAPEFKAAGSMTELETAGEVRRLLRGSVERSLDVDVPAGLTLSGGVDTSTILALAKELGLSHKLHTFSIRMDEPSFDETRYQRLMVEFAGPIHHEILVKPADILENMFSVVAHMDEPSGDGAAVPTFLLSREARNHVKVLLSGEGGDEIFGGYETHRAFRARKDYRRWVPPWARRALRAAAARLPVSNKKLSLDFVAKRFTEGAELGVPESHLFWRHVFGELEKRKLLTCEPPEKETAALFRELFDSLPFPDELDRLAAIDLKYYFIDDLMVKNDRPMMANSVETRFPYMERDVVDFAAGIPSGLKVRGMRGRRIQKLAMRDLLPRPILTRSNMGLEMPHSLWFFGEFRGLAEHYFSRARVERSGFLRYEEVDGLWREHLARKRDNGRALWCILNFLIWFDLFVYDKNYKEYLR